MGISVGNIAAKLLVLIGADTSEAEGGLGRMQGALGRLGGIANTAFGVFGGNLMTQGINNLVSLGKEALTAYASHERLGASLESLVAKELMASGSADNMTDALAQAGPKAEELLGWIQELAIKSPFTQEGVATAFRTAQAYGFTTDEAKRLSQAMIDFAAGSGATEGSMNTIALALGQIQAKGKLSGQEVLQLVNAGISVDRILAKAFGKSTEEIVEMREKGLIPADAAIEAIVSSLEDDFGGAAERQSETFSGLISSLSDIKEVGLREFFTGTFSAIQPYVTAFVAKFSDPAFIASLREIGAQIGGKIATALQFLATTVFPIVQNGITILAGFWTNTLQPAIQKVWQWMSTTLIPFLQNTVLPWLQTNIPAALQTLSDFWTNTLQPAIQTVWEWMSTTLIPFLTDTVYPWLQENIPKALQTLSDFWTNTLQPAIEDVWTFLTVDMMPVWEALAELLEVTVGKALEALAGFWEKTLKPALEDLWEYIKFTILKVFEDWSAKLEGARNMISEVVGFIESLTEALKKIKLPDWMTPGSPTPWEIGLRGVASAMRELYRVDMPQLQRTVNFSQTPAFGAGTTSQTTIEQNYSLTINEAGRTVNPAQSFLMLKALTRA